MPETKITEFVNSIDLDEVVHNEPPHLDLHCLSSSLSILNISWTIFFVIYVFIWDVKFVAFFFLWGGGGGVVACFLAPKGYVVHWAITIIIAYIHLLHIFCGLFSTLFCA